MAGYVRADVTDQIANGNTVDAVPLDGEFDAVQAAFASVGGHRHNGSVGEGAPITVIGPTQDVVASANSLTPKTDNAIDLGSSSFEWKDLYVDGTANIDSLVADTADINGGTIDGAVIGGSSPAAITATSVAATSATVGGDTVTTNTAAQTLTNKTINLANNTLVATSAQLAASVSDETGSGALVFAASPALSGVPTAPTAAADTNTTQIATTAHVFAERSNTATLTNKTLTSPTINGGTITGITDLAVADGGTGASDAAGARANLGLVIGTNVQAYDPALQSIAGLTTAANQMLYTTDVDTYATTTISAFGRAFINDNNASVARTTLELDSSSNVTFNSVSDASGDLRDLANISKTSAHTLVLTDKGNMINITTGGVTVPSGVFSAADAVVVYNNSSSPQAITQGSGVTLRLAGTTNTGNRTVAARGVATVLCVNSNEFVVSGPGVS